MKTKSKWYIVAGLVVFAGAFVAFGLNRSAQPQHFTAKAERATSTMWWKPPEP